MKLTTKETFLHASIGEKTIIEWNRKFRNLLVNKYYSLRRLKIRLFGYVISTISHLKGYK